MYEAKYGLRSILFEKIVKKVHIYRFMSQFIICALFSVVPHKQSNRNSKVDQMSNNMTTFYFICCYVMVEQSESKQAGRKRAKVFCVMIFEFNSNDLYFNYVIQILKVYVLIITKLKDPSSPTAINSWSANSLHSSLKTISTQMCGRFSKSALSQKKSE
jgi:hypothetical protein